MADGDETEVLEAQEAQRQVAKRASLDLFRNKRRPQQEFTFALDIGAGPEKYSMLFRAVSSKDWDYLVTTNPPTKDQQKDGMTYNPDTFGPAMLSRVCIDPVMNESEWNELWTSPEWSKGELQEIFWSAVGLCNRGLDVNPTVAVSE